MSKKRHNVEFLKPVEPSFLKRLKSEIGYKEGPTVDTKRETLPSEEDDGDDGRLEEQPQIVVLKPGDLNAEQVEEEKKRLEEEKNSRPANLDDKIIFQPTKKSSAVQGNSSTHDLKQKGTFVSKNQVKSLLSFDADDEEQDVTE